MAIRHGFRNGGRVVALMALGGLAACGGGGVPPVMPADSLTVQRIRSGPAAAAAEPLTVEPGNVWPEQEGPRATLANPEEALRGFAPRPSFPEAPPPARTRPLPPRSDGTVIMTPDGPVVTTGGTDRVQTTLSPQGQGVAVREGGATTVFQPGLPPRTVPTPR